MLEKAIVRLFSGESEGTTSVHDQVDPEHLHWGEGGIGQPHTADEDHKEGDDVDGELELQELLHVCIDTAAPENGGNHWNKVIVGKDHVRGIDCNLGSGYAHWNTDICLN